LEVTEMFGQDVVEYIPARPGEYDVTLCDYSKANETLDYNPVKNIDEYIKEVIG
jgi:nucleoside-diphosphate-sugar epimerase